MPKLKKGATPSELVKGVTATHMKTIGKKTDNDLLWIGAETTPFHHYVNCEFS
ncbi:hypothetical protein T4A_7745 [Trichinella pseudospiralis]|uniref:Uncharacterized protein n=1 Tax=Trichinella pseudospiralis TaxID=6337 RepID=A0A0V1DPY5_TRIPS|nr:hypothetical protein T4A_7745 [Trichinella pseudospiralis]